MATLSTLAFPRARMPHTRPGPTVFIHSITPPTSGAGSASGDDITLCTIPAGWHVVDGWLQAGGSHGSATLTLRLGTTAITAATTAGGADAERLLAPILADADEDRTINVLVGAAAITVASAIRVWLLLVEYKPLAG